MKQVLTFTNITIYLITIFKFANQFQSLQIFYSYFKQILSFHSFIFLKQQNIKSQEYKSMK